MKRNKRSVPSGTLEFGWNNNVFCASESKGSSYFTLAELGISCTLTPEQIDACIDCGLIVCDGPEAGLYSKTQLKRLHSANRLNQDFKINASNAAMALTILDKIERLEKCSYWLQFVCLDDKYATAH